MNIWAIVPVKPLKRAKSRLSPVLTPEQRADLSKQMLIHTLETLNQVETLNGVLVVTRDTSVLSIAREHGAHTLQETGTPELISGLTFGTQVVTSWGASAVMIVSSDIPFLEADDIRSMIRSAKESLEPATVVIAPDRRKDGTNVILMSPPGAIPFRFGEGSYHKHAQETRKIDACLKVYESPTVSLDIDYPEDLEIFRSRAEEAANDWAVDRLPFEQARFSA